MSGMRTVRAQRLALQGGWVARGQRQWLRVSDVLGGLHGADARRLALQFKRLTRRRPRPGECMQAESVADRLRWERVRLRGEA